jgi:hypothetical protein
MILVPTRHAGLVPASTEPRARGFEARQTPAQGRGDELCHPRTINSLTYKVTDAEN